MEAEYIRAIEFMCFCLVSWVILWGYAIGVVIYLEKVFKIHLPDYGEEGEE